MLRFHPICWREGRGGRLNIYQVNCSSPLSLKMAFLISKFIIMHEQRVWSIGRISQLICLTFCVFFSIWMCTFSFKACLAVFACRFSLPLPHGRHGRGCDNPLSQRTAFANETAPWPKSQQRSFGPSFAIPARSHLTHVCHLVTGRTGKSSRSSSVQIRICFLKVLFHMLVECTFDIGCICMVVHREPVCARLTWDVRTAPLLSHTGLAMNAMYVKECSFPLPRKSHPWPSL